MMPANKLELMSTVDAAMTPEKALHAGRAVGTTYRKVTVGMDLSRSSRMIRDAFVSGVLSVGSHVVDAGYVPSPAGALAARYSNCCAMVGEPNVYGMISGITLRNPDGSRFNDQQIRQLEKYIGSSAPLPGYHSISTIRRSDTVADDYIKKLVSVCGEIDCPVVVDCGCGSASLVAPQALAAAGADVTSINSHPDRNYAPRFPGIEAPEAKDAQAAVKATPGSIGILLNGDGTRVALIDEEARYVTGSKLLALLVGFLKPEKMVVPVDISSNVDRAFWGEGTENDKRRIIKCEPTPVSLGDTMREERADFGALANGTIVLPGMTKCPDGIFAAAKIAQYAGTHSLSSILDEMPVFVTESTRIHCTGSYEALGRKISDAIDDLDYKNFMHTKGWRVDMKEGWFLLGYPDQEGIMEIKVEASDKAYAVGLLEMAKEIVVNSLRSQ